MKMRYLLVLLICMPIQIVLSQITPTLEVDPNGIQIKPIDHTTVSNPTSGMLVYDNIQQAFMYYDGTSWLPLGKISSLIDTDGDTKIELIEGQFGLDDEIELTLSDVLVATIEKNDNNDLQIMPASDNSFIGLVAGNNNTGGLNSFFGRSSGFFNTAGSYNTFLGSYSGYRNTTGNSNVVIGYEANYGNQEGSNNVIIGRGAGGDFSTHNKSGNVFIGSYAGRTEFGDNKLIIENTFSGSNPLIYGDFGTNYLRIGGELNVNNAYTFPISDGSANQVLKTNGTGILSWQDDEDNAYWNPITGGITYNSVVIRSNELSFEGFGRITVPAGQSLVLRYNNLSKIGLYDAGIEWGPTNNDDVSLGSSTFRFTEVWATNGTIQTSDLRKKKNITNLTESLSKVMELRPVSYQWNSGRDQESVHLGFIAQELEEVIPEVIVYNEKKLTESDGRVSDDDTTYGVKYSELIPVLVKAIQDQQVTIDYLSEEIEKLKKIKK